MTRSMRKDEHVALALRQKEFDSAFNQIQLIHQSLPSFDIDDIDLSIHFLNHRFPLPIYINAMTGGSTKTQEINRKLATLAAQYQIPMAVGSQHAALDDQSLEASYRIVREVNPDGFVIANVNANASVALAQRAIDMIDANALGIHINPAQELVMDEGDRHFKHWIKNIEDIVKNVNVPVIVKEVGNGMSRETVTKLIEVGVKHVDLSGRGGTNFVWIENERSERKRYDFLKDWGITTVDSLLENKDQEIVTLIASGGIQTPLDVIKALVLGADMVAMSGMFLKLIHQGDNLDEFIEDLKKIMVLVDCGRVSQLHKVRYKKTAY